MKGARREAIAILLMVLGSGLFVYGLLNFLPLGPMLYGYPMEARLEAAIGAMFIVGGIILYRHGESDGTY